MNARDSIALLNGLIEDGQRTGGADVSGLNTFRQRGYMILRNIFGDESPHVRSWSNIDFEPRVVFLDASENEARYRSARTSGLAVSLSLLQTAIEELELFGQDAPDSLSEETTQELPSSRRVFIVHGHDDGFKETVARLLSRLDLEPIILSTGYSRDKPLPTAHLDGHLAATRRLDRDRHAPDLVDVIGG